MSLINEALKKAQRLRTEDQTGDAPPTPGGRVVKRGQARSSQTVVLIASGAIALVVVSVVVTFWLANRPKASPAHVATAAPAPIANAPTVEPAPLIVPVPITPAPKPAPDAATATASNPAAKTSGGEMKAATPPSTASPTNVASAPPVTPSAPPSPTPTPTTTATAQTVAANSPNSATTSTPTGETTNAAPAASQPTAAAVDAPTVDKPVASGPPKPDERIAAFVEAVRVTAIRANDNKVMMNDRMYRVNDIVERSLGVKLIKVAADSLTFADANGVTYVKFF